MDEQQDDGRSAFPRSERRRGGQCDTGCCDLGLRCSSLPLLSPKRLLWVMAAAIFFVEAVIMFLFAYLPVIPVHVEALLDAAALLIILSPTFYFYHYRPLMTHYKDRKKIIDQLCDSEERLNLALNVVNDGLWDWNLLTGEVYTSPRSSTMLGFQAGELGDKIEAWGERLHPQDRLAVDRLLREHLEGKSQSFHAEHRLRNKADGYIWVLARGQVVTRSHDNWPLRMIGTYTDITLRKQAEEALQRSETDIRTLSRKMMHRSEEEKRRLSRELHDEFGQVLCAFQLGVEILRDHNYGPPEQYASQCERLLALIARLEVDLRHMCDHLRPVILDDLGLVLALKWHLDKFSEQHCEVQINFDGAELKLNLSQEKEIALYRICQESLNNIGKYAAADRVEVELQQSTQGILLVISDNGVGFNEEEIRCQPVGWGLGLLGMRERAAAVGGEMRIDSNPGIGTRIEVVLPIEAAAEKRLAEAYA